MDRNQRRIRDHLDFAASHAKNLRDVHLHRYLPKQGTHDFDNMQAIEQLARSVRSLESAVRLMFDEQNEEKKHKRREKFKARKK